MSAPSDRVPPPLPPGEGRGEGPPWTAASLALALLTLTACGGPGPCGPERARVAHVVDGDTVELEDGTRLRYLLVDAPELSGGEAACGGAEARALNLALVEGRTLDLAYESQCHDRYGRLLAHAAVDGRDVAALLVERGAACVFHLPPGGEARLPQLQALEAAARAAHRGVWGACRPVPCVR